MAPHLEPPLRRPTPSHARARKFGETNESVLKRLQKVAEVAAYHQTGRESNIPPATSAALKEKKKNIPSNLQTSSLYFWWLFFFFSLRPISALYRTLSVPLPCFILIFPLVGFMSFSSVLTLPH